VSNQILIQLVGSASEVVELSNALVDADFEVRSNRRAAPGIYVRVREDSSDEAEVGRIASAVAPGHQRGPSASPTTYIEGYRES